MDYANRPYAKYMEDTCKELFATEGIQSIAVSFIKEDGTVGTSYWRAGCIDISYMKWAMEMDMFIRFLRDNGGLDALNPEDEEEDQ